jgi:hypothetical protein
MACSSPARQGAAKLNDQHIPRGKYLGRRLGEPPKDEAEHFIRCQACGGWIDYRDLAQVSPKADIIVAVWYFPELRPCNKMDC